jgi:hypothetical protein
MPYFDDRALRRGRAVGFVGDRAIDRLNGLLKRDERFTHSLGMSGLVLFCQGVGEVAPIPDHVSSRGAEFLRVLFGHTHSLILLPALLSSVAG